MSRGVSVPGVVLDTNILLKGQFSEKVFRFTDLASEGKIALFSSFAILEELVRKLNDPKFENIRIERKESLFKAVVAHTRIVAPGMRVRKCRDASDDMFIECAVEARAAYIITDDRDLLSVKKYRGVQIVRLNDFLKDLKRRI